MTAPIGVRISGTEAEVDAFVRVVEQDLGATVHSRETVYSSSTDPDSPLGRTDFVEVLINFVVSGSASLAADGLMARFRRFQRTRQHMTMEVDDPPEGSEGQD